LVYPDHPYGIGTLYGTEFDSELKRRVRFVIAEPRDLAADGIYSKERKLVEEVKKELSEGRRCQVFAVYTTKHDVTARLRRILDNEGIRTAVLRASVDTSKREAWYARQIKDGVQVVICHPKLVETGLDLLDFPTIIFYESGYSLHTLRQASRRSWRIGQRRPVRVKFLCYEGHDADILFAPHGKEAPRGSHHGRQVRWRGPANIDEDDDMLSAMARELVERNGIGETADAVWKALNRKIKSCFQPLWPATTVPPPEKNAFGPRPRMIRPAWSRESSTRHPFWSLGGDQNCHPLESVARDRQSQNRGLYSESRDGVRSSPVTYRRESAREIHLADHLIPYRGHSHRFIPAAPFNQEPFISA
jgi:hypothetical protein